MYFLVFNFDLFGQTCIQQIGNLLPSHILILYVK